MNEAKGNKIKEIPEKYWCTATLWQKLSKKIVFRPKHKEVRTYRGYWAIIQEE